MYLYDSKAMSMELAVTLFLVLPLVYPMRLMYIAWLADFLTKYVILSSSWMLSMVSRVIVVSTFCNLFNMISHWGSMLIMYVVKSSFQLINMPGSISYAGGLIIFFLLNPSSLIMPQSTLSSSSFFALFSLTLIVSLSCSIVIARLVIVAIIACNCCFKT